LKKDEIAILPQNGYYKYQNHSVKALQWIEFFASKKNIHIKHARNGGEQLIGGIPVDGGIQFISFMVVFGMRVLYVLNKRHSTRLN
jgi:hypothetical protein